MTVLFLLKLAVYTLISKRLRTLLTIGGIAISVAIMVLLLGIGNGLQSIVTTELAKTGSQNAVSVTSKHSKQLKLNQGNLSKLKSINGVATVEQAVGISGTITYHGIALELPMYGVTPGYFELAQIGFLSGKAFTTTTQDNHPIIVSTIVLKALGITDTHSAINKPVQAKLLVSQDLAPDQKEQSRTVRIPQYSIVGVVDRGSLPVAYIPAQDLFAQQVKVATEARLVISNPDKITPVRETVEQMGFQTSSVRDTIDQANKIFGLIRLVLLFFGAVTLAIAVFGTLNTITISLVEQTKQVGFLRILGIRKEDVRRLFIMQSILLSTVGVLVGILAGLLGGLAVNSVIKFAMRNTEAASISMFLAPYAAILLLMVASFGLGWVLGIAPARRAVAIKPLEAIRGL